MSISINEKRAICKRFVIDVLRQRFTTLAEDRRVAVQNAIDKILTPELQKAHAVLIAAAKANKDSANMLGLDSECDFNADELVSKVNVTAMSLHTYHNGESIYLEDKDFNVKTEINLRIERQFWTTENMDLYEVCPLDSDNPIVKELEKREEKLKDDSAKLFTSSLNVIRKLRTVESIEKNCPELAPYFHEAVGCESTDLADMASCMRVKEDC